MAQSAQGTSVPAVFNFESHQVRSLLIDDQPWFVATDVCAVLDIANATQAVQRLDDDERSMFNIGRQGETNIINESGLYSLILRSRKSEAKRFKKWVTSEVLPTIRKTGQYTSSFTGQPGQRWLTYLDDSGQMQARPLEKYEAVVNPSSRLSLVMFYKTVSIDLIPELLKIVTERLLQHEAEAPMQDTKHTSNANAAGVATAAFRRAPPAKTPPPALPNKPKKGRYGVAASGHRGIYPHESKYNPWRAAVWDPELHASIELGAFPTIEAAKAAQEAYRAGKPIKGGTKGRK